MSRLGAYPFKVLYSYIMWSYFQEIVAKDKQSGLFLPKSVIMSTLVPNFIKHFTTVIYKCL